MCRVLAVVFHDASAESVYRVPLNTAVMFGKASDEWETPQAFFDALDAEFSFDLDVAATIQNTKCKRWFGPDRTCRDERNALTACWQLGQVKACWLNPPYSKCRQFVAKAAEEARDGAIVVCLVPSRTDTRWFHESIWNGDLQCPRPGVEVRFIKGRLKFGGTGEPENSAPFPSMVVIFRPVEVPQWNLAAT